VLTNVTLNLLTRAITNVLIEQYIKSSNVPVFTIQISNARGCKCI